MNTKAFLKFDRKYSEEFQESLQWKAAKKMNPQPVDNIAPQPRGYPTILLEFDTKLIQIILAIHTKGGVVNIHIVCAVNS